VDDGWSWWRFGWGAIGAVAPEVVKLYNFVTATTLNAEPLKLRLPKSYIPVSLTFIAVGGAVAVAFGENSALKCMWVGVSLPAIVSSFVKQLPPVPTAVTPIVTSSTPRENEMDESGDG